MWLDIAANKPVLIVPLWNWNLGVIGQTIKEGGSNCTFMELKLPISPLL